MLRTIRGLEDYTIGAIDGDIGQVKDCYFDDHAWVVRYFVVDTGKWLVDRRVLISPRAIGRPTWSAKSIPVSLTRDQIRNSPGIDTERPVSRQHEISLAGYYGYPCYWDETPLEGQPAPVAEHHLRSCNEVIRYHVHASDGDIGRVQGLLVDDANWSVRYMIVNTSNWWLGHQVLLSPDWIADVSWLNRKVAVGLTREAVKNAPPYDAHAELDREQELGIYGHYGRTGYWLEHARERLAS